jgi:hypothetical protein
MKSDHHPLPAGRWRFSSRLLPGWRLHTLRTGGHTLLRDFAAMHDKGVAIVPGVASPKLDKILTPNARCGQFGASRVGILT